MSPMKYNPHGYDKWYPGKPKKPNINFFKKNEDHRVAHTVIASANMKQFEKNGIINEEDLKKGMELNAQHINMTFEEYSELVDLYTEEKERFNEESSNTEKLG